MSNNLKVVKQESIDFDVEVVADDGKKVLIKRPKPYTISWQRFEQEKSVLEKQEDFNKTEPTDVRIPHSSIFGEYVCQQYIPKPYTISTETPEEIVKILNKWYSFWGVKARKKNLQEELGSTLSFLEDSLPEEKRNSLTYKTAIERLKEREEDGYVHTSFTHGNLIFDHIRKDDNNNAYLLDFDFSEQGFVEDDISRFEVDEIINSWRHSLKPDEMEKIFKEIEISLSSSGMLDEHATRQFRAINYLKRTPFTRYYIKNAEEDLFEAFLVNAVNTLDGLPPISPPYPKKKIKVLNISWGLPGGVNSYIQAYTKPLEKLGFDFVEIGYDVEGDLQKFSIRENDGTFSPITAEDVARILQQGFDVINVHNYCVGFKVNDSSFLDKLLELRERTNTKIVYTAHGCLKELFQDTYDAEESPYVRAQEELLKHSDKIIANSYLHQKISELYGSSIGSKCEVVEPATDIHFYPRPSRKEVSRLRKKFTDDSTWLVTYFGRITEDKGIRELVDAISMVNRTIRLYGVKAKLLLIGPMAAGIEEYTDKDYVIYVGEKDRKELTKYILASDITVQPTYYDSFNCSILESILCGIPAVATDVAGPEYYFNGHITRAVWSDDYDERVRNLSSALLYVMRNYKDIERTTLNGQKELLFKYHPVKTAYETGWNYLGVCDK